MDKAGLKQQHERILDEYLVLLIQSGDQKALALLIKRWYPRILKQAYRHLGDMDMAKAIAQDSWMVIIDNIHKLKDPTRFLSWALTITSRKSVDCIRKISKLREERGKMISTIEDRTDQNQPMDQDQYQIDLKTLQYAMMDLKNDQRIILKMYYLDGFSVKTIAEILSIASGTVKSRLFNAREKLRKSIKSNDYENK